ncbi:MAG: HAMP domain-containing histidine kinase [Bacteroidetes bacterium]|jgi:signal transduction histidine kinase|nr:HAMP domain-containing histidine kinase [Bacteroidota bacterium]
MDRSSISGSISSSGRIKILLLGLAFLIVAGILFYTYDIVQRLHEREQRVAGMYARSLEYIANAKAGEGDYSFVFNEVVNAIDFPMIETDPASSLIKNVRNVPLDSTWDAERRERHLRDLIREMDQIHTPIVVAYQDTIILSRIHYGESPLITQLRLLPFVELAAVAVFILIGYISFSYIKRSEQSSIWVGMARETAHQLGTPISSLLGWTELLRSHAAGNVAASETLAEMSNDLQRLQKIADRFSKIGSRPDLREEPVTDIINHVVQYFQRRIPHTGKKVTLAIEANSDELVSVNRELFEWVIENLTKNALDAIESGEGRITYTITGHHRHVFIDVTDTGKGIDPKHRAQVFRPGFSTKKRGWGLGLSLAKRIVESYHSGRLTLKESRPGVGTTFRIKLKR